MAEKAQSSTAATDFITAKDVLTWCIETNTTIEHSFAIDGELNGASDDDILRIASRLQEVFQPRVVDRRSTSRSVISTALITTERLLERAYFPAIIAVPQEYGGRWRIVWPLEPTAEGIPPVLSPQRRGSSRCLPPTPPRVTAEETPTTNVLVAAMERLVGQFAKMNPEGNYRRLRTFSGLVPTPAGEEGYETWRNVALQYLEEWQCSDALKRQRIVESLKGPAMEIVQAAWRGKPQVTSQDYMTALEDAFGSPEDATDLLYKLRITYQEAGEKMSDYLYRLDKLIYRVVSKGGLDSKEVDNCRLDQMLRGALTNDPIAQRLRCTDRDKIPLSFHQLLKQVRQEEATLMAREQTVKKVAAIAPKPQLSQREEELLKIVEKQGEQIAQLLNVHTKDVERLKQATHKVSERQLSPQQRASSSSTRRGDKNPEGCFVCGSFDHMARHCSMKWSSKRSPSPLTKKNYQSKNGEGGQ
ncbi:paraneoplastic antigen Ma2 homolog [Dendropsophus ebraccatus]|uniref:paraneoplastic antigen Ma2 homolog n=1 Tax=Dendropsophus ebraccatus TaxID=150705 RepID=UPI003831B40A